MIETTTATVYRATWQKRTKRFLTLTGACSWLALQMLNSHPSTVCECEAEEYETNYPGYDCGRHDYRARVHSRLERFLRYIITHPTAPPA